MEKQQYQGMDLKILKDEELIQLIDYAETVIDAIIPDLFSLIPEDCMQVLMEKGETQGLPQLFYIDSQLFFIYSLEREMETRGLLHVFQEKKAFVNYEQGSMYTYANYAARYSHLCYFKKHGFLELDKVISQAEKARDDYSRILKEQQLDRDCETSKGKEESEMEMQEGIEDTNTGLSNLS